MRIAIIGAGISGMVCAYLLSREHEVTVFEANDYIGGHTHTVQVRDKGTGHAVDTGFIVFNELNYPNFSRLLDQLGVDSQPSQMSFSVRCEASGLEYGGTSLNALFSQRGNLLRPSFYRMILGILKFYREAPRLLETDDDQTTLGEFLERGRYSREFIDQHLVPMGAAIWSSEPSAMLQFPARYLVQFFQNHGFLKLANRPRWRVVAGGSFRYVERLVAPYRQRIRLNCAVESIRRHRDFVEVKPRRQAGETFDYAVVATHSDQALRLLSDPDEREQEILSSIAYRPNDVVLHTDSSLLPRRSMARAGWNYHLTRERPQAPTVTYHMNTLQNLRSSTDFCVTLNRNQRIDSDKVLRSFIYHHPVYTRRALAAQRRCAEINGARRTFYCGAYWGYGFHEDGVNSALRVCEHFGEVLR